MTGTLPFSLEKTCPSHPSTMFLATFGLWTLQLHASFSILHDPDQQRTETRVQGAERKAEGI